MKEFKSGYDFPFNGGSIKQEDAILSIVEGRMVPRDLSNFDNFDMENRDSAYLYVDKNGKPTKTTVDEVMAGSIKVVSKEPEDAGVNQIIFKETM